MLTKTQLHELYYWLLLNRTLEDRIVSLHRAGRVPGTVYTSRGQEAISVGTAFALEKDDIIAPLLRNTGSLLVRGIKPEEIISQYMGRLSSPTGGRDCALHLGDLRRGIIAPTPVLGSLVPVVAGIALAAKLRKLGVIALTYIGDGGSETSDFHEGLNLAAVRKVPMVLVLENNSWAFSTPAASHAASVDFIARARAYGVSGFEVDGNRIIDVYETTREAAQSAREGRGPALIVAHTMRTGGLPGPGDAWHANRNGMEEWRDRDPIRLLEQHLSEGELASHEQRNRIAERVRVEIDEATARAAEHPFPDGSRALGGVYHEA